MKKALHFATVMGRDVSEVTELIMLSIPCSTYMGLISSFSSPKLDPEKRGAGPRRKGGVWEAAVAKPMEARSTLCW